MVLLRAMETLVLFRAVLVDVVLVPLPDAFVLVNRVGRIPEVGIIKDRP
jgi:hypothetical protein